MIFPVNLDASELFASCVVKSTVYIIDEENCTSPNRRPLFKAIDSRPRKSSSSSPFSLLQKRHYRDIFQLSLTNVLNMIFMKDSYSKRIVCVKRSGSVKRY
jgi:hypothetical protein